MKKILYFFITLLLLVCVVSSGCIAPNYSESEIEQEIINQINELRVSEGLQKLTFSDEASVLCKENSQKNADNPTYVEDDEKPTYVLDGDMMVRKDTTSSEKHVCVVPNSDMITYPIWEVIATVYKYDGDLEKDAKAIIDALLPKNSKSDSDELDIYCKGYQKIGIGCVIKNNYVATTIILYSTDTIQPKYSAKELQSAISKLIGDKIKKEFKLDILNAGKIYKSYFNIDGYAHYLVNGDLTGNLNKDAETISDVIINDIKSGTAVTGNKIDEWERVKIECEIEDGYVFTYAYHTTDTAYTVSLTPDLFYVSDKTNSMFMF